MKQGIGRFYIDHNVPQQLYTRDPTVGKDRSYTFKQISWFYKRTTIYFKNYLLINAKLYSDEVAASIDLSSRTAIYFIYLFRKIFLQLNINARKV